MEKFHRRLDRAEAEHITIRNFLKKIPSSKFIVRIWDYLTINAWQLIIITVDRNKEQNTFFYVLDFNGTVFIWLFSLDFLCIIQKPCLRVRMANLYHKENIGGWCFKSFNESFDLIRGNKLITRVFCYFLKRYESIVYTWQSISSWFKWYLMGSRITAVCEKTFSTAPF